ncbi:MAG: hypothetical protein WCT10_00445 [Patescibacteria group bacterium]|jgi:hypothetical protein
MEFTADFCRRIWELTDAQKEYRRKLKRAEGHRSRLKNELDALRSKMGFREKYLAGWFGGNRGLTADYQRTVAEAVETDKLALRYTQEIETAAELAKKAAIDHLAKTDPDFARLNAAHILATNAATTAESLLHAISTAVREVDKASNCETFDLFSKSKMVSALSHIETEEAKKAIQRVNRRLRHFQEELDKYRDLADTAAKIEVELTLPDDTLDLIFDLSLNGNFDFLSLLNLNRLAEAGSGLAEIRQKAADALVLISKKQVELQIRRDQAIADVIDAALKS